MWPGAGLLPTVVLQAQYSNLQADRWAGELALDFFNGNHRIFQPHMRFFISSRSAPSGSDDHAPHSESGNEPRSRSCSCAMSFSNITDSLCRGGEQLQQEL